MARDAAATLEEVLGAVLASHEVDAHAEHSDKVEDKYRPVEPAEVRLVPCLDKRNLVRPDAGHRLASAVVPTSVERREGSTSSSQSRVARDGHPRVGYRVVGQHIRAELVPRRLVTKVLVVLLALNGREEDVVVHASEEEDVAVAAGSAAGADESYRPSPDLSLQGRGVYSRGRCLFPFKGF